jgi:hypothetical protein
MFLAKQVIHPHTRKNYPMTFSITELGQDTTFQRFLGATVGKDNRATDVTVLSMLARLNVDPWDEASELSKMSHAPVRSRLNTLWVRFTDVANAGR